MFLAGREPEIATNARRRTSTLLEIRLGMRNVQMFTTAAVILAFNNDTREFIGHPILRISGLYTVWEVWRRLLFATIPFLPAFPKLTLPATVLIRQHDHPSPAMADAFMTKEDGFGFERLLDSANWMGYSAAWAARIRVILRVLKHDLKVCVGLPHRET